MSNQRSKPLTAKQENFCNYYLETSNASEAYRRAYDAEKCSDKTIWERSSVLLSNDKVKARIKELQLQMQKRSDITKDEAVSILADIARANIVDAVEIRRSKDYTTMMVKDLASLPKNVQRAIISVKASDRGYEIKLYNKIDAIEKLSKLLGWDAPVKQEISVTQPMTVEQAKNIINDL